MNQALLERIEPARRRLRGVRFWWLIATIAAVLLASTLVIDRWLLELWSSSVVPWRVSLTIAGAFLVAALGAWVYCRLLFRDPRIVARKIELRFPGLQQRLLTALSQSDNELGYLKQRVVKEARDHSRAYHWTDIVPTRGVFFSRFFGVGVTGLLAFALGILATSDSESQSSAPLARFETGEVQVEPGNTEIERGSSLVVTARFPAAAVPESARLVRWDPTNQQQTETMTRNLSDPVVGVFLSSVGQPFRYRIETPTWKSPEFTVDVFEYPELVRSDADLDYPQYTRLSPKRIEDTVRVAAIEGTRVTWICFLNKQVEQAVLVDQAGEQIVLRADEAYPDALVATLDLRETQRLKLQLTDSAGRKNKFPPELIARVLPNQPPELRLTSFGDASVSPLEELPLEAEVSDDVGVAEVGLSYSLDGETANEIVLGTDVPRQATSTLSHLVELENLDAEPDQLFAYHFWAEDIGPDGKLRRTNSDMFFAEVRPLEQIFREGQPPPGGGQRPGPGAQQASELAELQKEIINATWRVIRNQASDSGSRSLAENTELLIESQQTALGQLQAVASMLRDAQSKQFVEQVTEHMRTAVAELKAAKTEHDVSSLKDALRSEQMAYAGLLKLRSREFQVSRSRSSQGQPGSASQRQLQQQLNALELEQDENRYEAERTAQAESEQEQQRREIRQILNRLRELARRQQDLNKQIAELQNALQQAKTEEEQRDIERRLKRLREQQQELLRQTDELSERMQQNQHQQQMRQANEKLQETRRNVQQASEALQQQQTGQALSAGRRAERQFEEMRDEFRRQAAGEFDETMREMRRDAGQLKEKQDELSEQLRQMDDPRGSPGLRSDTDDDVIEAQLAEQRKRLESLLEQMQQTVEEAETAEPLLAQNLYDAFRRARQQQVDRELQETEQLLQRGFVPQARRAERQAGRKIEELKDQIDDAAESVLGDETKALKRALAEIEQLDRELAEEIATGRSESIDPTEPSDQTEPPAESDPPAQSDNPTDRANPSAQSNPSAQPNPSAQADPSDLADLFPQESSAPIGGDDFQQWSDRLRDVEEMVGDPALRNRAAQIRDRARGMRRDLHRNDEPPRWNLVEQLIAQPLRELRRDVAQELLRRSAERNAPVPIDRDPVPAQFSEAVRRYYESLGGGGS